MFNELIRQGLEKIWIGDWSLTLRIIAEIMVKKLVNQYFATQPTLNYLKTRFNGNFFLFGSVKETTE